MKANNTEGEDKNQIFTARFWTKAQNRQNLSEQGSFIRQQWFAI
jgi:hypothetical protein